MASAGKCARAPPRLRANRAMATRRLVAKYQMVPRPRWPWSASENQVLVILLVVVLVLVLVLFRAFRGRERGGTWHRSFFRQALMPVHGITLGVGVWTKQKRQRPQFVAMTDWRLVARRVDKAGAGGMISARKSFRLGHAGVSAWPAEA